MTHTCEPLARLIHTQAFEWDANSEKFVSCIHSVPQPKQPSVESVAFSLCPAGEPLVGRRSVPLGPDRVVRAQRPRQTRGAEPQSVPLGFYNSTPEAASLALSAIGAGSAHLAVMPDAPVAAYGCFVLTAILPVDSEVTVEAA